MIPLIDLDVLFYEIGFCGEYKDEEGEHQIRPFEFVQELLDAKIEQICHSVGATEPPKFFYTGKGNFREAIAKKKGYKANRNEKKKPFHFDNIKGYMEAKYDCVEAVGMEADDLLCIEQCLYDNETVICSRDKDLKMCPGWHYSWECGAQPEWGPKFVTTFGWLEPKWEDEEGGKLKKLIGTGLMWFYCQLLMGDPVDNIPGLPRMGPKKVWQLLHDAPDKKALLERSVEAYKRVYGDDWYKEMEEQGRLVWMVQRLSEGKPVMWEVPNENN